MDVQRAPSEDATKRSARAAALRRAARHRKSVASGPSARRPAARREIVHGRTASAERGRNEAIGPRSSFTTRGAPSEKRRERAEREAARSEARDSTWTYSERRARTQRSDRPAQQLYDARRAIGKASRAGRARGGPQRGAR